MENINLSQSVIKYYQIIMVKKWYTSQQSYTDDKLTTYVRKTQTKYGL